MKFPHIALLFLTVLSIASFAEGSGIDTLKAELDSVKALDNSKPGVLLTGEFRSGVLTSVLDNDGVANTGVNAATEVNIELQARPTKETRATALFRVHQDWQKAYEEGVSQVLFDWLSYDGKALGGIIDFNLGDMRIAYTPLTIYAPLLDLPNEAEIFTARRRDAMGYRHLQDDGNRLLQGLNFALRSGQALVFEDLYLQGTLARLRAQARKYEVVFFDYDDTDRILFAGRGGLSAYGVSLGANYTYTFTREEPLKNLINPVAVDPQLNMNSNPALPFLMENISVFSGTIGVDIARFAGLSGWKIDLGAEYAISNYKSENFYTEKETLPFNMADSSIVYINGERQKYELVRMGGQSSFVYRKEAVDELDGKALLASLDMYIPANFANTGLKLNFIKNDKNFVSELAQNPVYYTPAYVLNSSAINLIRGSTLENLYFATYTNDPLTQYNLSGAPDGRNLVNNNKKSHFIRSGYSNLLMPPKEYLGIPAQELDPGVNLSLPFGLATPNRQGVLLKAESSLLNDKLGINAFVNKINESEAEGSPSSYLDAGGGLVVEVGKLAGIPQTIRLNGGYALSTETDGYERSVNRASAGLRIEVLPKLYMLGGMEMINKNYGSLFADSEVTGDELLWLAGPEFELSRGSYLNLQFGMLNYEFKVGEESIKLDRTLISADVRIKF